MDGAKRLFEPGTGNYYVDFYRVLAAGGPQAAAVDALGEGVEGDALAALEQAVVDGLEVTAPDDRTVVYQLNKRSPVFTLLSTMWPLYPVRLDIIDANGDAWTEAGTHISNGAFKLDVWNHNENISLVRNDEWHRDPVMLDRLNMDMIEDTAIAFLAYQEGELDMITLGPAELVQVRGTDFESEFHSYAQLVTIGIYFNNDDPSFANQMVRQAFAGALDRDEYAEIVREGAVLPAYGWLPPGIPGYDDEVGRQYENAIAESKALYDASGVGEIEVEILSSDSSTAQLTAELAAGPVGDQPPGRHGDDQRAGARDVLRGAQCRHVPGGDRWLGCGLPGPAELDAAVRDRRSVELRQLQQRSLRREDCGCRRGVGQRPAHRDLPGVAGHHA